MKTCITFLFSFLLITPISHAEGLEILGGGWSYHYDRGDDWNESHNLIGLCMDSVCVASYRNSYNVSSLLGYYYHPLLEGEHWQVSAKAGFMGGYSQHVDASVCRSGVCPMVGLGVSVKALTIDSTDVWVDSTVTPAVLMFNLRISL